MMGFAAMLAAAVFAAPAGAQQFDHQQHQPLFSECTACHSGVRQDQAFPDPSFCETCHNGSVQPRVDWSPPAPSDANLTFRHSSHPGTGQCSTCHVVDNAVVGPQVSACFACHGIEGSHFEAPSCDLCHTRPPAPASHTGGFVERHGVEAASAPQACATCHVRSDCLDCHRPGAASPAGGYHPADFLSSHPVAAYRQETECADCHNVGAFCQTCHQQAGLVSGDGNIGAGYHDAKRFFIAGHGQAARQGLTNCVACHTQQDCVRCHVNVSPHGPDFEADDLQEAQPEVCAVCHTRPPGSP
jgi:hypothetical protein